MVKATDSNSHIDISWDFPQRFESSGQRRFYNRIFLFGDLWLWRPVVMATDSNPHIEISWDFPQRFKASGSRTFFPVVRSVQLFGYRDLTRFRISRLVISQSTNGLNPLDDGFIFAIIRSV